MLMLYDAYTAVAAGIQLPERVKAHQGMAKVSCMM